MFDTMVDAASLTERIRSATRAENQAAGARLVAVGEFDLMMLRRFGERETWCSSTSSSIIGEIAAALQISRSWAEGYLYYARALRLRLPAVGALLCAGDISYLTFKTIVFRTDLITDEQILADVDAALAVRAARWPAMTRGRLAGYIDKIIARADRDAVRQRREAQADREVVIFGSLDGLSGISGRLVIPDAQVLDARLNALAATVCPNDPRTHGQRRADALGALAAGADRLTCRCENPDCPAGDATPSPIQLHVIAEQASIDGSGQTPAALLNSDILIPAELLAELARTARLVPLAPPVPATPPEAGRTPSKALADFIRARDLTCRFPGCDEPAANCDIDHTTPYADGGRTHASNLKAMCRRDHLLKTFWGWRDEQLPDATVIWRSPTGQTYVTTPGSAWLFPQLCTPTGELRRPDTPPAAERGRRNAKMPRRRHTRAESHARYVKAERARNRRRRQAHSSTGTGPAPPGEPPPF